MVNMSGNTAAHPKSFVPVKGSIPQAPMVNHTLEQRRMNFLMASLLLDYPGLDWEDVLDQAEHSRHELPAEAADAFGSFIDWAKQVGQERIEKDYVETFDQRRRCCLELTYYATGDTRQRGIALTVFQDLYAAVGWVQDGMHLPDYLPTLLELAARSEGDDFNLVQNMIGTHRQGIEVLHAALWNLNSPWARVVEGLRTALPEVADETFARMQELIRKGPPAELVGINSGNDLPWPVMPTDGSTPGAVPRATPRADFNGLMRDPVEVEDSAARSSVRPRPANNTGPAAPPLPGESGATLPEAGPQPGASAQTDGHPHSKNKPFWKRH